LEAQRAMRLKGAMMNDSGSPTVSASSERPVSKRPGDSGVHQSSADSDAPENRFLVEALDDNKREGMRLAVYARWAAMVIIAVMLIFVIRRWEVLYYHAILAAFALIGYLMLQVGRTGRSRPELALIFCDLVLMAFTIAMPNPFDDFEWSGPMQLRYEGFSYFYVLLAIAVLSYSWRTIVAIGTWTAVIWSLAVLLIWWQPPAFVELSDAVKAATAGYPQIQEMIDPQALLLTNRIQEIVVFFIVAGILAVSAWRWNRLVLRLAATQRERTNLARYFSPNVVEELSHNDDPLKQVRMQDVAVLFVDIVGFTRYAEAASPQEVIVTLRRFHALMEAAVFAHGGTLDKYLGDGLMATFGTPSTGTDDAGNALKCARAMVKIVRQWNESGERKGVPPIRVSVGLHFGKAVLGDIGGNRLEFAVIGTTVNVAARLEALTRDYGASIVVSEALIDKLTREPGFNAESLSDLQDMSALEVKGIAEPVAARMLH
jgi:adenylate cyclase